MASLTFNPDTHPESTSWDGAAARGVADESYSTMRGGNGTYRQDSDATTVFNLSQDYDTEDTYNDCGRAVYLFDTSELGAGATVTAATFSIVVTIKVDTTPADDYVALVDSNPASNTGTASADYQNMGATLQADNVLISNINADSSTFNDWTLNAAGLASIETEGITKFGMRVGIDLQNSDPGGWVLHAQKRSSITAASAEETLSSDKRPKMVVTYTVSTFTPRAIMF